MDWLTFFVEITKALAWPLAVFGAVVLLRDPISDLLRRFRGATFGGASVDMQQPEASSNKPVETPAPPLPAPAAAAAAQLTPEQQDALKQILQAQHAAARLWEYRYLNLFLAPPSQHVLTWFASLGYTTLDAYDAYWAQHLDGEQRKVILQALNAHHLVEREGPVLRISEKGREYVTWRGPLPAVPAPQPAPVPPK
jgi:hypothetical protein